MRVTRSSTSYARALFPALDPKTGRLDKGRTKRRKVLAEPPSTYEDHFDGERVDEDTLRAYRNAARRKIRDEDLDEDQLLPLNKSNQFRRRPFLIEDGRDLFRSGSCITPMRVFDNAPHYSHVFEDVFGLCTFAVRLALTSTSLHAGRIVLDYHKSRARPQTPDPYNRRFCSIDGKFVHSLEKRIAERSQARTLDPDLMSPSERMDFGYVRNNPNYLEGMIYNNGLLKRNTLKLFFKEGDIIVLQRPSTSLDVPEFTVRNGKKAPNPDRLLVRIDEIIPEPEDPNFGVLSVFLLQEIPIGMTRSIIDKSVREGRRAGGYTARSQQVIEEEADV